MNIVSLYNNEDLLVRAIYEASFHTNRRIPAHVRARIFHSDTACILPTCDSGNSV